jgi:predicted Zn-dependent peptidase
MYQKSKLQNGIRIVSEYIPYVKSVSLGVWVGTGSRSEETHNHGISHFIEHMMFKGTKNRSAKAIAETVDAIGGQLNAFTAKEHTCYYIKVLDTHFELAVDILSDMLLDSAFQDADIMKEREVVLEEFHMYEDAPDELIHDIHLGKIWSGHSLGRNILGSKASIEQFHSGLIREYCSHFYTPDNIVIAAAGNITHEKLEEVINRYFGEMTGNKRREVVHAPELQSLRTMRHKATEQIHLCLSSPGVPYSSPEIYPMHIINNVLGGGISSWLFQSIREDKGLAYSIYSFQSNYSDTGLFTVYAGTRPANAMQVMDLIFDNIKKLKREGISKAELIKTKEQLKGNLLLGLESSSSRMSRLGKLEITLGKYVTLEEVVEKIDRVSSEDLQQSLEALFDESTLSLTILGPGNEEMEHAIKGV